MFLFGLRFVFGGRHLLAFTLYTSFEFQLCCGVYAIISLCCQEDISLFFFKSSLNPPPPPLCLATWVSSLLFRSRLLCSLLTPGPSFSLSTRFFYLLSPRSPLPLPSPLPPFFSSFSLAFFLRNAILYS